jgi:hypothetical protein
MVLRLFVVLWVLVSPLINASAQSAGDYLVSLHTDLVKTDNSRLFNKAQFGAEGNYFLTNHFTATMGLDVWTADEVSFIIGGRWFPNQDGFIRARGLIGENDISIGGGWVKPLGEKVRFEAMADFYFKVDFSIRAGLVYFIRRNKPE